MYTRIDDTAEADSAWCALNGEKKLCVFRSENDCIDAKVGTCVVNENKVNLTVGNVGQVQQKLNDAGGYILASIAVGIGTAIVVSNTTGSENKRDFAFAGGAASVFLMGSAGYSLFTVKF